MTEQGQDFFRLRCEYELERFKESLKKCHPTPAQPIATTPPHSQATPQPTSPNDPRCTVSLADKQDDSNIEILHSKVVDTPLNAWVEDPTTDV